jgi:hypothetical protein
MTSRLGLVLALVIGACTTTPASTDTAAAPTTAAPVTTEPPASDDGATPPTKTTCNTNADCDGGVCEGEGCGEMMGTCAAADRMCTRDLQTYCGCDGKEFGASGSCPGARFSKRGPCEAAAPTTPGPDGSACESAGDCASGVCEGEGCDKPGVCVAKNRACTKDLRQYCGCDGKTFSGSGSCPGARFSKRSAC